MWQPPLGLRLHAESVTEVPGWVAGLWRVRVRIPADFTQSRADFTVVVDRLKVGPEPCIAWVAQ